jgi:hypothetical protein
MTSSVPRLVGGRKPGDVLLALASGVPSPVGTGEPIDY